MIGIGVDVSGALSTIDVVKDKQVPFAVALALNWTGNDAQAAERYRLKENFILRRQAFNLQGIYISKQDRATKSSWRVVIQVQADRDYLDRFEAGGYHLPEHGRWIWKPNPQVFRNRIIPAGDPLSPKGLKFQKVGRAMEGNERTFMVKSNKGLPLVLQRQDATLDKRSRRTVGKLTLDNFKAGIGPQTRAQSRKEKYSLHRTAGVRLLYQLVERVSVPIKLEFVDTVGTTARNVFPGRLQEAMRQAMRSAR